MRKNKYRWRTFAESLPDYGENIIVQSLDEQLRFRANFIQENGESKIRFIDEDGLISCKLDAWLWRPIKSKLKKYRWREMKDEKPKDGEIILFCFKPRDRKLPMTAKYERVACNKDEYEWINYLPLCSDGHWGISQFCRSDIILWRKMCKLPGDE